MDMTARELFKIPYYYVQTVVRALGRGLANFSVSPRACLLFSAPRFPRVRILLLLTRREYTLLSCFSLTLCASASSLWTSLVVSPVRTSAVRVCMPLVNVQWLVAAVRIASPWLFLRMPLGCDGPSGNLFVCLLSQIVSLLFAVLQYRSASRLNTVLIRICMRRPFTTRSCL